MVRDFCQLLAGAKSSGYKATECNAKQSQSVNVALAFIPLRIQVAHTVFWQPIHRASLEGYSVNNSEIHTVNARRLQSPADLRVYICCPVRACLQEETPSGFHRQR